MTIRLGIEGPEVIFKVAQPPVQDETSPDNEAVVAHYVEHYFGKAAADQPVGEHTMFVRKAFAQVQTKQKRRYGYIVGPCSLPDCREAHTAFTSTSRSRDKKPWRKIFSTR